jgi:hypothetical protein
MPSEEWINRRRGFDISIPKFVMKQDGERQASGFGNCRYFNCVAETTPSSRLASIRTLNSSSLRGGYYQVDGNIE